MGGLLARLIPAHTALRACSRHNPLCPPLASCCPAQPGPSYSSWPLLCPPPCSIRQRRLGVPLGQTLLGKTVLIVGFGNIARELAVRWAQPCLLH